MPCLCASLHTIILTNPQTYFTDSVTFPDSSAKSEKTERPSSLLFRHCLCKCVAMRALFSFFVLVQEFRVPGGSYTWHMINYLFSPRCFTLKDRLYVRSNIFDYAVKGSHWCFISSINTTLRSRLLCSYFSFISMISYDLTRASTDWAGSNLRHLNISDGWYYHAEILYKWKLYYIISHMSLW